MNSDQLGDRSTVRLEIVKLLVANGKPVTEKEVDRLEGLIRIFSPLEKYERYLALTRTKAPRGKTSSQT